MNTSQIAELFPDEDPNGPSFLERGPLTPGWYYAYLTGVAADGMVRHSTPRGAFRTPGEVAFAARTACKPGTWYATFHLDNNTFEPYIDCWTSSDWQYAIRATRPLRLDCGLYRVTLAGHWQDLIAIERAVIALGGEVEQNALRGGEHIVYLARATDLDQLIAHFRNNYGFEVAE